MTGDGRKCQVNAAGITRIFAEEISTRAKVKPELGKTLALARELRSSGVAVTIVIHEHKRLGRGIELAQLAEQLRADGIALEFLAGELRGSHDPSGAAVLFLAPPVQLREPHRQAPAFLPARPGPVRDGQRRPAGQPYWTPLVQSDSIFTAFGEELGLAGVMALLLLYGLFVQRVLRTAMLVRDDYSKLLVTGLSFMFTLQVFVIVGGATRLIPFTGITTPFLSQGGSSLIAGWLLVAVFARVSDTARRPAPKPIQDEGMRNEPPGQAGRSRGPRDVRCPARRRELPAGG